MKDTFWKELIEAMHSFPRGEREGIGADYNEHVDEGDRSNWAG